MNWKYKKFSRPLEKNPSRYRPYCPWDTLGKAWTTEKSPEVDMVTAAWCPPSLLWLNRLSGPKAKRSNCSRVWQAHSECYTGSCRRNKFPIGSNKASFQMEFLKRRPPAGSPDNFLLSSRCRASSQNIQMLELEYSLESKCWRRWKIILSG